MSWKKRYIEIKNSNQVKPGDIVMLKDDPNPELDSWTNINVNKEFEVLTSDNFELQVKVEFEDFEFKDDIDEENEEEGFVRCTETIDHFLLVKS